MAPDSGKDPTVTLREFIEQRLTGLDEKIDNVCHRMDEAQQLSTTEHAAVLKRLGAVELAIHDDEERHKNTKDLVAVTLNGAAKLCGALAALVAVVAAAASHFS